MKRETASARCASACALATITRMVRPRTIEASVARAIKRIFPSLISLKPNGGAAHPTSTWLVMTAVRVEDGLPVAVGFAPRPNSLMNASTTLWVEDPLVENAIVLPSVSFKLRIGEEAFAYQ